MNFSDAELKGYVDEALPAERMTGDRGSRAAPDSGLLGRLAAVNGRRDAGVHSLGEIWRRNRLTCPTREQLGSFLLNVLPDEAAEYIRFHLNSIGCRYCQANLADLESVTRRSRKTHVGAPQEVFPIKLPVISPRVANPEPRTTGGGGAPATITSASVELPVEIAPPALADVACHWHTAQKNREGRADDLPCWDYK